MAGRQSRAGEGMAQRQGDQMVGAQLAGVVVRCTGKSSGARVAVEREGPDMTAQRRSELAVLAALTLALLTAVGGEAAIKTRTVMVLPYATGDLGRQEQWIGEGIAQALSL